MLFILLCLVSSSSQANFTIPIGQTNKEPPPFQQLTGSGADGFYYPPPKFPPKRTDTDASQSSYWLVPVMRYLIIVSSSSITMKDAPAPVLLSVLFESATSWWLHEQQVLEATRNRGETPVGAPIPVDGGGNGNGGSTGVANAEGSTSTTKSDQNAKPSSSSPSGSVTRQNDNSGGDSRKKGSQHTCGELCPACNGELCYCDECKAEQGRSTKRETPETTSPGPRQRSVVPFHQQNIARLLSDREAGTINHLQLQHLTGFSQHLLSNTEPTAISVSVLNAEVLGVLPDGRLIVRGRSWSGSDPDEAARATPYYNHQWSSVELTGFDHTVEEFVVVDQSRFITRAIGHLHLWKEKDGIWSAQRLGSGDGIMITPDQKIITWTHRCKDKSEEPLLWVEHNQQWVPEIFLSSAAIHTEPAIDDTLFFLLRRRSGVLSGAIDGSLRVWFKQSNSWSYTTLPARFSHDKFGMLELDTRTMAIVNPSHLGIWHETETQWVYTELANDLTEIEQLFSPQKRMLITREHYRRGFKIWVEHDSVWKRSELDSDTKINGMDILSETRFLAWSENTLTLWTFVHDDWQSTVFPANNLYGAFPLKDGRFLVVSRDPSVEIDLWYESAGGWSKVILSRPELPPLLFQLSLSLPKWFSLLPDGRLIGVFRISYNPMLATRQRRIEWGDSPTEMNSFYIWDLFTPRSQVEADHHSYERNVRDDGSVEYLQKEYEGMFNRMNP